MNQTTLRVVKKKSKKALKYLKHFSDADVFIAEKDDAYHASLIRCGLNGPDCRKGFCSHNNKALKGTPMIGDVSGYYEQRSAIGHLQSIMFWAKKPESVPETEWLEAVKLSGVEPWRDDMIVEMMKDD